MNKEKIKQAKKFRRSHRTRLKIKGTAERPRLTVFRSLCHIYAQCIDDNTGRVLAWADDRKLKGQKTEIAKLVGERIAKAALEKGIKKVVFDRGAFKYHGRVKALSEGVRTGGLEF